MWMELELERKGEVRELDLEMERLAWLCQDHLDLTRRKARLQKPQPLFPLLFMKKRKPNPKPSKLELLRSQFGSVDAEASLILEMSSILLGEPFVRIVDRKST